MKTLNNSLIKKIHEKGILKGTSMLSTDKSKSVYEFNGKLYTIDNVNYKVWEWVPEDDIEFNKE